MTKRTAKTSALIGSVLVLSSGLLYVALEITTRREQAQTPGEKDLGVAVLGMIFGIPMVLCAAAGVVSFAISVFAVAFNRLRRTSRNSA